MALSQALSDELSRRPPKPSRGVKANLIAGFLNWPHLVQVVMQRIVVFFQGLIDRGPLVFVSTRRDVLDVMDRDEDFPSGPLIGPTMVCGPFVLGTDRGPLRDEDLPLLWETFYGITEKPLPGGGTAGRNIAQPRNDLLFDKIRTQVQGIIAAAYGREKVELDLIQDVFRPVCVGFVQEHFGVGPPDEEWNKVLWDVLGSLALRIVLPEDVDLNNTEDPVAADLVWAKWTLKTAINDGIDAAIKDPGKSETVIERMYDVLVRKTPPLARAEIRGTISRNVAGLAIAACHPITKAAAHACDILLSNKEAFDGATAAAKIADEELFWPFVLEALRFFPLFPVLARACPRGAEIGNPTGYPRKVRAGQLVQAGMLPAMFDADGVPSPRKFDIDRPPEDSLVFGRGIHACFGFQFARGVLVAMLMPLFASGCVRAPGRQGKLSFDLLVPKSLRVKLPPLS